MLDLRWEIGEMVDFFFCNCSCAVAKEASMGLIWFYVFATSVGTVCGHSTVVHIDGWCHFLGGSIQH